MPIVFKTSYPKYCSIIDCFEVFVQRPGQLTARAQTWSNYKHNNTIKFLVSITPTRAISFVSKAVGGRTSDKVITLRSGFLDKLQYGEQVMADRGFQISEELAINRAALVIPAFTKGNLSSQQKMWNRHGKSLMVGYMLRGPLKESRNLTYYAQA